MRKLSFAAALAMGFALAGPARAATAPLVEFDMMTWPEVKQALADGKTIAEIAQKHDVHPNQVTEWRRQLLERAADVFGAGGGTAEPAADLKDLHAKIGQQALEIDFLAGALNKAGLLSVKR